MKFVLSLSLLFGGALALPVAPDVGAVCSVVGDVAPQLQNLTNLLPSLLAPSKYFIDKNIEYSEYCWLEHLCSGSSINIFHFEITIWIVFFFHNLGGSPSSPNDVCQQATAFLQNATSLVCSLGWSGIQQLGNLVN